ncbi:MAG: helix-turn-helix domain-containing protein [Myxococcales bacterium]|nr:helix-turn-helix domain-containing protein [Myxococcales bacterium]
MVEERFEQAATEARAARLALAGAGQDDLINQLAMLETLACIEHEDMVHARAAARVIDEAGSRQRVASLYRAIVRYADGEARAASVELRAAHAHMRAHGDTINEYLADYYGGAALSEIGELGQAQVVAERAWQLAHRAGLRGQAARSRAQQALFAADAVQSGLAHRLAAEALASPQIGPRARARAHCAHARAYAIEGELPVALDHVAQARLAVAAPELAAARAVVDVEEAAIGLTGGDFDRAVELTERALAHDRGRARIYEASRAQLVLAAALVARARRTDLLSAGRAIALARELADRGHLRPVQVGCAILSAALARRGQRDRAAGEVLAEALRELDPERGSLHAGALMAAIDGGAIARAVPGVVALLAHLGFREAIDGYLVDRQGRRAATDKDLARARATHELFVDERRAVIVARQGAVEIKGRPMLCALLAVLVQARGAPVSPEVLYQQAWGVATYHPLQHRNALYVAINRLRSCLREILPGREVIERASTGWRLVDDVDACAAVAAPR